MRKNQSGWLSLELAVIVIWLLGIGGWIANVVKIVGSSFDPITGLVVARCIGVVVGPLGAVLGYV